MESQKKSLENYSAFIWRKLILICSSFLVLYIVLLQIFDTIILKYITVKDWKLTIYGIVVSFIIAFTPYLSYGLFYFRNKKNFKFRDLLAHCRYNRLFPFHFYTDANKKASKRIDFKTIAPLIKNCDIVLRRYTNYLDGLIFSQNSYFSHVGIVYRDAYNNYHVYHAEGKDGVHMSTLEEFLVCDDVAFLRFSFNTNHDVVNIRQYVIDDLRSTTDIPHLNHRELTVFDSMVQKASPKTAATLLQSDQQFEEEYAPVILERARSLLKTAYDLDFNFTDFNQLSCIEFVWYCFKCLFPVHQIKVQDFEYFKFLKLPVIIPDVFIKNKHFRFIYTSLPNITRKKQLKKRIKKGSWQLISFLLVTLFWEAIIFSVVFFLAWRLLRK